ncbi:MAG: FkbM family methyltransferase [Candidatus Aramenus sp.]|jgi:FkbM family methyltransferase|nr:FkbM family methyltransferase [Candidatus Aramenus sp.]
MKSLYHQIIYNLKRIRDYQKIYSNWFDVILQRRRRKERIFVKLKDGSSGLCNTKYVGALVDLIELVSDLDPMKLHFQGDQLYYGSVRLITDTPGSIILSALSWIKKDNYWYYPRYNVKFLEGNEFVLFETFVEEQYNVDVNGEVVDVGANIGDSSIYFAIKGAKKVLAFEPLPSVYQVALENVKLNKLENVITLVNAGVGSSDGVIKVPSTIDLDESGGFHVSGQGDAEVPVYSLKRIRGMVKDPYLLKMDCEGCEVDVILNSEDIDFEKIIFEHHAFLTNVPYKRLTRKLEEEGYACGKPRQIHDPNYVDPNYVGVITCEKRR